MNTILFLWVSVFVLQQQFHLNLELAYPENYLLMEIQHQIAYNENILSL